MSKDLFGNNGLFEVKYNHCEYSTVYDVLIVDSSNTDRNSAWMAMGLRSVFNESTIKDAN